MLPLREITSYERHNCSSQSIDQMQERRSEVTGGHIHPPRFRLDNLSHDHEAISSGEGPGKPDGVTHLSGKPSLQGSQVSQFIAEPRIVYGRLLMRSQTT